MPPLSRQIVRGIRLAHVHQLAQMEPPAVGDIPIEAPPPGQFGSVIDWIKANPGALKAAQETQCSSTSASMPNWDAVFFSLMESSAMYLRKPEKMADAILAAGRGDYDDAISYLEAAQEDIDTVANELDCTFIQLCDFSKQGPKGTWLHSGAFCGLFISNSNEKPFMGVAFKGSNTFKDFITDADWRPIAPPLPEVLWGAETHRGFSLGLFGQFKVGNTTQVPFDVLQQSLAASYHDNARLHFTGHSLGGAYCTMTYGEFLRRQSEPAFVQYNFGDMYSLAAPRNSLEPFAAQVNALTLGMYKDHKYLFRIVNRKDPVPTVPPPLKTQLLAYPFVHVGGAWKLDDNGPYKMDDEPPPVEPQPIHDVIVNIANHQTSDYYASWQKTLHH